MSRGVLLTIAISCKRIEFGVDYIEILKKEISTRMNGNMIDLKMIDCINELGNLTSHRFLCQLAESIRYPGHRQIQ